MTLSPRLQQVYDLLAEGLTRPEIAERLFISRKTVDKHKAKICDQLGIESPRHMYRYILAEVRKGKT
jgi:DNA-binding NarL/FixJ family response regulator